MGLFGQQGFVLMRFPPPPGPAGTQKGSTMIGISNPQTRTGSTAAVAARPMTGMTRRTVWNAAVDRSRSDHPTAVAPECRDGGADCRELTGRSAYGAAATAHSAGRADAGLMIDLSLMGRVQVDPCDSGRRCRVVRSRSADTATQRVRACHDAGNVSQRRRGPDARRRDGLACPAVRPDL